MKMRRFRLAWCMARKFSPPALGVMLAIQMWGCAGDLEPGRGTGKYEQEGTRMSIQLTSPAFTDGGPIPAKHTCDGEDLSPPLVWSGVPEGTESIALICDDPDAPVGTWVHWVLFDLPPATTELAEGMPTTGTLSGGGKQGKNDFGRLGYGGPCPPRGAPHRYFFKIYALDTVLNLNPGATKRDVERAMKGHVLAQGQLMGTYRRR